MTILRTLTAPFVLIPFLALAALAQDSEPMLPEPLGDTLSDFAEVLNATEEGRISRILAETREQTGVQIVVVTLPGTAGMAVDGTRLEDFGRDLFDAWGIGDKDANDGILLLIDDLDHEARITLGSGYAEVYDARAARVLASALLPNLREGEMAAGIEAGIIMARDQLVLPFLANTPISATDGFEAEGGLGSRIAVGAAGIFGFLGVFIWRKTRARKICPNCRALALKRDREVIAAPTKYKPGIGVLHLTCASCGFVDRQSYAIAFDSREGIHGREDRFGHHPEPSDSGRSADTGGFGGGQSGDGGASGKW